MADIPAQLRLRACFMQARNPSHISHIAADLCDSDGCACERAALVAGGPRVQAGRAAFGQAAALAGGAALRVGRGDAGGGALSAAAECRRGARGAIHDGSVGWGIAGGEVWVGLGSAAAQHHRAPCAVRRAPCAVRSKPLAGSRAPEAVRRKPRAGSRALPAASEVASSTPSQAAPGPVCALRVGCGACVAGRVAGRPLAGLPLAHTSRPARRAIYYGAGQRWIWCACNRGLSASNSDSGMY